jgi:hyperosmotically inducible protein
MAKNVMRGGIAALLWMFCISALAQPPQSSKSQQRPASQAAVNRIQHEVRHQLLLLPRYGVFDSLSYKVDGYNVTLSGYVRNASLKSEAAAAVKGIEGVENVDNKIEILPTSPNDDNIRIATYRALYGQPPLDRYALLSVEPIHIIVKNGRIILEGTVQSQSDKNVAEIRAKGVPGAFAVDNQLQVEKNQ